MRRDPVDGKEKNRSRFWAFWTTLPGVLTGAAALLTAVVALAGLWPASGNNSNRSGALGDSQNLPAAEIPATTATPTSQPETTATTGGGTGKLGEVIRRGQVTLTNGDNIDFVTGRVKHEFSGDVILNGIDPDWGELYSGRAMAKVARSPDRAGCVKALKARSVDRLPHPELPAGTWVCMTTEEGNIVALRIIRPVEIGHPQVVFAYTLWR